MIEQFLKKPAQLLLMDASSSRGAAEMSIAVSQYVAARTAAFPALLTTLADATSKQKQSIGRGLYRVVVVCGAVDPSLVMRVDAAARKISDRNVVSGFRGAETEATTPRSTGRKVSDVGRRRGGPGAALSPLMSVPMVDDPAGSLKLADPFSLPKSR